MPVPQPSSAPPTPTRLTGANSDLEEEERGDLIQFYNNIYIKQIKSFAMKYSQANIVSLMGIISQFLSLERDKEHFSSSHSICKLLLQIILLLSLINHLSNTAYIVL